MAVTYKLIAAVTVGSGGAASIDFTSIPQTYTDLLIVTSIRSSATGSLVSGYQERLDIFFNGSTTSYTDRWIQAENGTSVSSGTAYFNSTGTNGLAGTAVPSDWTSNTFNNNQIYIPNYTLSQNKSSSIDSAAENNAARGSLVLAAGLWASNSAITSISLKLRTTPNMVQHSTAYLYGIKNS